MSFESPIKPEMLAPLKSLKGLAYILRHKEYWPKDFEWEFSNCGKCAMGLAVQIWSKASWPNTSSVAQILNCEATPKLRKIFLAGEGVYGAKDSSDAEWDKITPAMVADAIDKYLEQEPS